ncbi:MAG: zinc ribbon domain-containing protein [Ruminococcus sp.]|nr:zinc ribbon domain-containing protein [Ruminococcus sp.]
MNCRFCGRVIDDRAKFCPGCGNSPDLSEPIREKAEAGASGVPFRPQAKEKVKKTNAFWAGKLVVLSAFVCFVMPFFSSSIKLVSGHSRHYSGAYVMFDAVDDSDSKFIPRDKNVIYSSMKELSYMVSVAAMLAVIALFLPKLSWICSGGAAFVLMGMYYILSRAEMKPFGSRMTLGVKLKPEYGLVIAIGLLLLSAVIAASDEWTAKKKLLLCGISKPDDAGT